jgi:hypothetical protein
MAHLSVKQRVPFKKSFVPSLRQSRQTESVYLANLSSPIQASYAKRFRNGANLEFFFF